ncbi:MAG: hypothetical protein HQK49_10015 [Oligoflexia bacterium]|nr:hypothetical protein [Oligoflexia bacterium]
MDLGITLLGIFISYVIKIMVMTLSVIITYRTYKAVIGRSDWIKIPEIDLHNFKFLFISIILFCMSELVCGIESYLLIKTNYIIGILHSIFSSFGQGFFLLGIYEIFNGRLILFAEKGCLINRFCKGCTLIESNRCKFSSITTIGAWAMLLATIPPLFASIDTIYADSSKYVLPFTSLNSWFDTSLVPMLKSYFPNYKPIGCSFFLDSKVQFYDSRVLPLMVMSLVLLAIFFIAKKEMKEKNIGIQLLLFCSGTIGYSYYQIILNRNMGDLFLGALAHEVAELIFLIILFKLLPLLYPPTKI